MLKTAKYQCLICNTNSDQLSHHKSHLKTNKHNSNKKIKYNELINNGYDEINANSRINNLETFTYSTQYCFINNKKISIDEYSKNYDKYKNEIIKDINNNELIYCNGKKVSHYFRHINPNPSPMSEWHKEWQSYFDEYTEKTYKKYNEKQIKARRTDVDLNETQVIEFQYSYMSKEEADNRKNDYNILNKEIIWVICGNTSIEVYNLENSGRVFLDFINEQWKYESYISYDFIYMDINEQIYKIYPKYVKSHMIDVQKAVSKITFIESLKKGNDPFSNNFYDIDQTRIYISQMGAGNGKTYSIIQLIKNENLEHYKTLIYLTKQHSARHVILTEIRDQIKNNYLDEIQFNNEDIEYLENKKDEPKASKQDIIRFKFKKNNNERRLIIGTFDSLIYSLANKKSKGTNKFLAMVNDIIDNEELRCSKDGILQYTKNGIKLNKTTLLIGDEMQDLHLDYIKAIFRIMLDRYVDFYVVGDKLQSISIENNAFTFLQNNLPIKKITRFEPINKCRRFSNPKLSDFVNNIIDFDKFNLPSIELVNIDKDWENTEPLKIFPGQTIYATDIDENKINNEVENIMKYYRYEVDVYNRMPNDFLIVTLFVNKNPLVEALNIAIREFWENKNVNQYSYYKYCFFHKSEDGTSIDLSESDDLTRIVSTHSSKGDGRKIVFIIGFTEEGLKLYSHDTGNLIYESLLHVAITRMKEKLYFRLEENGDDIHMRIQQYLDKNNKFENIKPIIKISNSIKIDKMIHDIDYLKIYEHIIEKSNYNIDIDEILDKQNTKKIIDMKHHNIRYITMMILSILKIIYTEQKSEKFKLESHRGQFYKILEKISNYDIIECHTTKKYYQCLKNKDFDNYIPLYKYKNKSGDYQKYYIEIKSLIDKVQLFIKEFIKGNAKFENINYLECIVLYYLIEMSVNREYSNLPISDLYDIIDLIFKLDKNETDIYTNNHYEKLKQIDSLWNIIIDKYPTLNYLYKQPLTFDGKTEQFILYNNKTYIIGYNETEVILFLLKPQFNNMNFDEILKESLTNTFLIQNIKKYDKNNNITENYKKFYNKKILTYVITSEFDIPYIIDWNNILENNKDIIINILKDNMVSYYQIQNNSIWLFFKYWRHNTKSDHSIISLNKIIDEYENIKKTYKIEYPKYIDEFFYNIKSDMKKTKKKKDIIQNYDNQSYFKENLNQYAKDSIEYYFWTFIDNDESDDEFDNETD